MKTSISTFLENRNVKLAVVIPAYKAEKTIRQVIESIPAWIDRIIVVNDCSPDSTTAEVHRCSDERIFLVTHENNLGVGGAMLTGYRVAFDSGIDIAVKMDSDGQMDPSYIPYLIIPLLNGKADYTKGNRFLHQNELTQMPIVRRVGNLGLSFMTKLASGYWNIFDPTNGFTAIRRQIFECLNLERIDKRYFFETSMLCEMGIQRAVVKDVRIPAKYTSAASSLSERKSFFEFPPKLLKALSRRIVFLYFIRDFTPVSLLIVFGIVGIVFGLLWGIIQWAKASSLGVIASTGTVMISVLPLILGIQFILQALTLDIENVPEEAISNQQDYDAIIE